MASTVEVTIPPELTAHIVEEVQKLPGIIGIKIQHNVSIKPLGDVLTVQVTNRKLPLLMSLLTDHAIGINSNTSISTSRPSSLVSPPSNDIILKDTSESNWEEIEQEIAKESNMTINSMIVMAIAGFIAASGILTNTLHVVIGAMVIAPGFEPLSRIALGITTQSQSWQRGVWDTVKAYAVLIVGAAIATFILYALGTTPSSSTSSYLPPNSLVDYWSSITASALLVSAAASIAGAILLATNRAVLTAGVMIGLALVPAAAMMGIALVDWNMTLLTQGGTRLLIEIALVCGASFLVFMWKRIFIHKRKMLF
jgi:hypothetical protein